MSITQLAPTAPRHDQALDALRALDAALAGRVVAPGDPDWDESRQAWALAVDQRPFAVALPESAADVVALVALARDHGLRVAPQGTGHNAHPLEGALDGTILVKTSRMRGVAIDPVARRARVEAGALWGDVTPRAAEHGLAALAGSSPDVGVVGYTLGGGLSWLARRYGLASERVLAAEVVTADGELVRTDRDHEPDLFWALRGGGGSFGIVTALEFELLPLTHVYAGALFFGQERAAEVLQAWRELTQRPDLPDEFTSVGRLLNVPPFPEIPEPLRGRSFVLVEGVHLGGEAEGEALISPLRALGPEMDTFATVPVTALAQLHMDPDGPVPGKGDGVLLREAPAEAVDALVAAATPESGSALVSAELRHAGGALARPAGDHGALSSLQGEYVMFVVGAAPTPELRERVVAEVTAVKEALAPWEAAQAYGNFAERPVDPARLYAGDHAYRRLGAIKAAYDPTDVFQANHPIAPPR